GRGENSVMDALTTMGRPRALPNSDPASATDQSVWMEAALRPDSIAVIGASNNPDKIGGRPIKYMRALSYSGRLYPINPARQEVQGLKAYSGIDDLPEVPQMAIVCVPGMAAVEAVEQCADAGVRVCVIISSGFGETGAQGQALQTRMLHAACRSGM